MKIAVTTENNEIYQHFGSTPEFTVYTAEDGKIISREVISTNGTGHGALIDVLAEIGAEAIICGGIGGGARNGIIGAGIRLYPGVCGNADEAAKAFVSGSLNYDPNTTCHHHDHEEGHTCAHHCH